MAHRQVLSRPASVGPDADPAELEAYARRVFDAVFDAEIKMKLSVRSYKGAEHTPKPLNYAAASVEAGDDGGGGGGGGAAATGEDMDIYKVPTLAQNARAFARSVVGTLQQRHDVLGDDVWSKDVPVHLDFVTAASNLRATVFSIPCHSQFKIKEICLLYTSPSPRDRG